MGRPNSAPRRSPGLHSGRESEKSIFPYMPGFTVPILFDIFFTCPSLAKFGEWEVRWLRNVGKRETCISI